MSRDPRRAGMDVGLRDLPQLVRSQRTARRRRALAAVPDLTYLFWEATVRCNLRCRHCGSSCEPRSPHEELTTAQILRIVEEIAEDFDARRICVAITGGEPLLRRDLERVIARMVQHGMQVGVVTNGLLLGAERARSLVEAGISTVAISLDGRAETHEQIRGPGTYAATLAALTHAREAGIEQVEALTCVRPANLRDLPALEVELVQAGANAWRLLTIDRMGRVAGPPDRESWLEPASVRVLLDFIAARREQASRTGLDVSFSCGGFAGVRRERTLRDEGAQCYAGLVIGGILCDGQVSACPSLPRSWAQGSALEQRFSQVWANGFERHRSFEWRRADAPCAGCDWFDVCLGGGLHERLAQPQDFCWLERQVEGDG